MFINISVFKINFFLTIFYFFLQIQKNKNKSLKQNLLFNLVKPI
jgi:hypothetical protein